MHKEINKFKFNLNFLRRDAILFKLTFVFNIVLLILFKCRHMTGKTNPRIIIKWTRVEKGFNATMYTINRSDSRTKWL